MAAGPRSRGSVVRFACSVVGTAAAMPLLTASNVAAQADTSAPSVTITSPATGAAITGTVTATADAADNTSVAGVQFLLDGVPLGAEKSAGPYSIDWNSRGSRDLVFGIVKVKV